MSSIDTKIVFITARWWVWGIVRRWQLKPRSVDGFRNLNPWAHCLKTQNSHLYSLL